MIKNSKKIKILLITLTFLAFVVAIIFFQKENILIERSSGYETKKINVAGTEIIVELANTEPKRIVGLGGRKNLDNDYGMLFIFNSEGKHGIWMKNMFFPIDIVWLNSYGEIIDIEEKVRPETYPKVFKPDQRAAMVLEVASGFVEERGISIGDIVEIK